MKITQEYKRRNVLRNWPKRCCNYCNSFQSSIFLKSQPLTATCVYLLPLPQNGKKHYLALTRIMFDVGNLGLWEYFFTLWLEVSDRRAKNNPKLLVLQLHTFPGIKVTKIHSRTQFSIPKIRTGRKKTWIAATYFQVAVCRLSSPASFAELHPDPKGS